MIFSFSLNFRFVLCVLNCVVKLCVSVTLTLSGGGKSWSILCLLAAGMCSLHSLFVGIYVFFLSMYVCIVGKYVYLTSLFYTYAVRECAL